MVAEGEGDEENGFYGNDAIAKGHKSLSSDFFYDDDDVDAMDIGEKSKKGEETASVCDIFIVS